MQFEDAGPLDDRDDRDDPFEDARGEWLHPSSLLFSIGASVRSFLIPGLAMVLVARGGGYEMWLMLLFIPAVVHSIVRFLTLRYILAEDEIIIRKGVFVKTTRHIPYARIQNIDQTSNLFHRLFRVANVKIETASGGMEAEASLKVLSLDAVRTMRRRVFEGRKAAAREKSRSTSEVDAQSSPDSDAAARSDSEAGPEDLEAAEAELPLEERGTLVSRMSLDDVVAYGMMSNRGFAIVAAMLGVVWQFDLRERIVALFDAQLPDLSPRSTILVISLGGLAAIFGIWLLSVVWAILRLFGYRLVRDGDDLRMTCGLLTRHTTTTPRYRIQFLAVREALLHRLFGRLAIRTETAGGDMNSQSGVHRNWLVPMARREDLTRLLGEIQPEVSFEDVDWRGIDTRALRRLFRKGLVVALVISAGLYLAIGFWTLIAFASLVLLSWISARIRVRVLGYSIEERSILLRDGWWTRSREAVRFAKIQTLSLSQSPFDRRYRMASVTIDTAGAWGSTQRIRIPFLPLRVAARLMRDLRREAAATEFRW